MNLVPDTGEGLSARGRAIVANPPAAEYIRVHMARKTDDPFHPEHNPDGYIPLCVAENKLVSDLILQRFASLPDPPASSLGYDAMVGGVAFRTAIASLLGSRFAGRPVEPGHVATLAGAGTVVEALFYAICDPGDAVLIPTPSYATFWADLGTRDKVEIVPVPCSSDNGFRLTTDLLDQALAEADRPVKALLLTSPTNPLGTVLAHDDIQEIVEWTENKGIHLVADEVYAHSVYGDVEFVSVAHGRRSLGDFIHVIWAFSKDFGASGLRAGVLWSENEAVLAAVDGLAYWSAVSGHTQHLLTGLVNDDEWLESYQAELQRRLRSTHQAVTAELAAIGVDHVSSTAGIFIFCDFRPFLTDQTWDAEANLWRRILDEANVNLTPGAACHSPEPGWMRLCFAAEPTDRVIAGIRRVGTVLGG